MVTSDINQFKNVYYPVAAEEVKNIVNELTTKGINIIAMGNGSRVYNFIGNTTKPTAALCLNKLNKVIEINPRNFMASVEPGITFFEFQEAVKKYNMWLPILSMQSENRTIGGMIADNIYNYVKYRYNNIGDYIIGLEFVTPSGQIIKTGGKTVKNVAGYDFTRFLNGSFGTLGIITKVALKLKVIPQIRKSFLFKVHDIERGIEILREIHKMALSVASYHIFNFSTGMCLDCFTNSSVVAAVDLEGSENVMIDHLNKLSTLMDEINTEHRIIESTDFWNEFDLKYRSINMTVKIAGTVNKKYLSQFTNLLKNNLKPTCNLLIDEGTGDFILHTCDSDYESIKQCIDNKLEDYSIIITSDKKKPHPLYRTIKTNIDKNNCLFSNNTILSLEDCIIRSES
ncbi:FAD-binding oxidoreductase [Desulfitobacterium sp. AusDCA]|uniref:FAD-binding oxidoreductase n=1 Tax=Desulfitobacterium sp. AusDCA TaxID=3240383 RepID=UPI003DA76202